MKKILLGLVAAFALTTVAAPVFAEFSRRRLRAVTSRPTA
jgi:hypothetical protein